MEGQGQRRKERHGRASRFLFCRSSGRLHFPTLIGIGVIRDLTVQQADDAGGIFFGQFRIVSHHNDQAILGDIFEDLHNLHAGGGVQSTRRLVGQKNFGIVDQGAGNGHALHLSARELAGPLMHLIRESHLGKRIRGTAAPLRPGYTGERQCQFHVGKYRLVRDQIVALEHESDRVIPIGIPILILVFFCGSAGDDQITRGVPIQAADDIQ